MTGATSSGGASGAPSTIANPYRQNARALELIAQVSPTIQPAARTTSQGLNLLSGLEQASLSADKIDDALALLKIFLKPLALVSSTLFLGGDSAASAPWYPVREALRTGGGVQTFMNAMIDMHRHNKPLLDPTSSWQEAMNGLQGTQRILNLLIRAGEDEKATLFVSQLIERAVKEGGNLPDGMRVREVATRLVRESRGSTPVGPQLGGSRSTSTPSPASQPITRTSPSNATWLMSNSELAAAAGGHGKPDAARMVDVVRALQHSPALMKTLIHPSNASTHKLTGELAGATLEKVSVHPRALKITLASKRSYTVYVDPGNGAIDPQQLPSSLQKNTGSAPGGRSAAPANPSAPASTRTQRQVVESRHMQQHELADQKTTEARRMWQAIEKIDQQAPLDTSAMRLEQAYALQGISDVRVRKLNDATLEVRLSDGKQVTYNLSVLPSGLLDASQLPARLLEVKPAAPANQAQGGKTGRSERPGAPKPPPPALAKQQDHEEAAKDAIERARRRSSQPLQTKTFEELVEEESAGLSTGAKILVVRELSRLRDPRRSASGSGSASPSANLLPGSGPKDPPQASDDVPPPKPQATPSSAPPKHAQRTPGPEPKPPPYTGPITLAPGVDLSNIKKTQAQPLSELAARHGLPESELRVLVFVRHGQSQANAANRFAGNEVGLRDAQGEFVELPTDQYVSMPNGELLPPGGQFGLTQQGRQQAAQAGQMIDQLRSLYGITQAQISPVQRAQETFLLATNGGSGFRQITSIPGLAERGQGSIIGLPKPASGPPPAPSVDPNRPISDRTGPESFEVFNARINATFRGEVLPAILGQRGSLGVSHQFTIAGQLRAMDPRVDTSAMGHNIPNGEPLLVVLHLQRGADGQPRWHVLEAGYVQPKPFGARAP